MSNPDRTARVDAIRSVKLGPFGPNALAIISLGGTTALTPDEAERILDALDQIPEALAEEPTTVAQARVVIEGWRVGASFSDRHYSAHQAMVQMRAIFAADELKDRS